MKKLYSYIRLHRKELIKNCVTIVLLIVITYFLYKIDYNWTDYKNINYLLMSCSGIFSAIVISVLISGLNNLKSQRLVLRDKINILSDKLTAFRRVLYFVIHSDGFWNNAEFSRIARQIRQEYPRINAKNIFEAHKDKTLKTITKNEQYGTYKMSLFINLLTIVDIHRSQEINFIMPANKYKYTLAKLEYYHECFNNIWFYLDHKPAKGLNDNSSSLSTLYRSDFVENYKKIDGETIKWEDFNSQLLVDLGNKFYEEINPELHRTVSEITSNIPSTYIKMIITLIVILIFGTIIPLIISATKTLVFIGLLKLCFITTILALIYLISLIVEYTFNDSKIY